MIDNGESVRDGAWPNTSDPDLGDLMLRASQKAEQTHQGVMPDYVWFGKRRYGRGFRWVARNSAVESSFPSDRHLDAWREAWWLVWCEDDHRARQAAS